MANFGASDVAALLRDTGVTVTIGASSTKAIKDVVDEELLRGEGMPALTGRSVMATLQQGTLPGLVVGAAITVDGEAFKVSAVLAIEDGELLRVICAKA